MPILRQDVNTGSAEVTAPSTNYQVGTASPQVNQEQVQPDARGQSIKSFLGSFLDTFTPKFEEAQQAASSRGAIEASQDPNALQNSDAQADKQSILFRDSYQKGYLGAAVQQTLTDFQTGITQRAQQAAVAGNISLPQFLQNERQQNAEQLANLDKYLPHMDDNTVQAVAQSLNNTKQSAINLFQKVQAGAAKVNNNRTIEQGSSAAMNLFGDAIQHQTFDQAYHYIQDQVNMIGTNALLTQDEKRDQISNLYLSVAQNTNDPQAIQQLAQKASGVLGVTNPGLLKSLKSRYDEAAGQQQGATWVNLSDRLGKIATLPVEQQQDAKNSFTNAMMDAYSHNLLSTGQMQSFYEQLHKEASPEMQLKGILTGISQNGGSISVSALQGAMPKLSTEQIRTAVLNSFPDTIEGNTKLISAGHQDPWIVSSALKRVGSGMSEQLNTLAFAMTPTKDDQGNTVYNIPKEVSDNVNGFLAIYGAGDSITKQTLINTLPQEWQGVIAAAAATDPQNANNNVLNTIKRVQAEKTSHLYDDVDPHPSGKKADAMFDTSNAISYLDYLPFVGKNGTERDDARAQLSQQLHDEYAYLQNTDPAQLSGKSPQTINQLLWGNIKARTVGLNVGGMETNVTLPRNTSLDKYAQNAGVASQFYQTAFENVSNNVFAGTGINKDNVQSIRILPNTAGGATSDFTMVIESQNQAGITVSRNIAIPMQLVNQQAQSASQTAMDQQRADGEQKAGYSVASFNNAQHGGVSTIPFSGTNKVGWEPLPFNDMLAKTAQYEGFKDKQSGGSIGFGWHQNSGDTLPDSITLPEAKVKLKELYENRYIPMLQKYVGNAGFDTSQTVDKAVLPMLGDLTYQRPADAQTMVNAMAQYQKGQTDYPTLIKTLQSLPSWKDAGGGDKTQRNVDRVQALYQWASMNRARANDRQQNPFGSGWNN